MSGEESGRTKHLGPRVFLDSEMSRMYATGDFVRKARLILRTWALPHYTTAKYNDNMMDRSPSVEGGSATHTEHCKDVYGLDIPESFMTKVLRTADRDCFFIEVGKRLLMNANMRIFLLKTRLQMIEPPIELGDQQRGPHMSLSLSPTSQLVK